MNDIEARVRNSFARQTMMQTLGAQIASIAPGRVTITGVAPGWYRIRFRDGIAYVSADFIAREN